MLAVKKGKMRCAFKGANGSTVFWTLFAVKVVQGLQEDLFSVKAELSNGGVLSSDERKNIVLEYKNGQNIIFDRRCETREGWIAGIEVLHAQGKWQNFQVMGWQSIPNGRTPTNFTENWGTQGRMSQEPPENTWV